MSKIETRIVKAYRKTREIVEELYYGGFFTLIVFQIVLVLVTKITEKIANKIIK